MNSQEQMGIYKEMEQKGWLNSADLFRTRDTGVYGRMYRLIDEYNNSNGQRGLLNTTEARNAYLREAEMRNTDWFDVLFTNAVSQNHSVSITAGTEKSSFYASLSAMLDPGWYKQSKVKRYTANVNTTYNIYKKSVAQPHIQRLLPPAERAGNDELHPRHRIRKDVPRIRHQPLIHTRSTQAAHSTPSVDYISNYAPFNILHELDNNYIEINMVDVKFQGEMKWKVVQGLELSALGAVRYQTSSQEHNVLDDANQAIAYRTGMDDATIREQNKLLYTDPDNPYAPAYHPAARRRYLPASGPPYAGTRFPWNTLMESSFRRKAHHQLLCRNGSEQPSKKHIPLSKAGECNIRWGKFRPTSTSSSRTVSNPVRAITAWDTPKPGV